MQNLSMQRHIKQLIVLSLAFFYNKWQRIYIIEILNMFDDSS